MSLSEYRRTPKQSFWLSHARWIDLSRFSPGDVPCKTISFPNLFSRALNPQDLRRVSVRSTAELSAARAKCDEVLIGAQRFKRGECFRDVDAFGVVGGERHHGVGNGAVRDV